MEREFTDYLIDWKESTNRKPLIVRGARQIGKSYCIQKFGENHFSNIIQLNFEESPDLKTFFTTNDVNEIIKNIEVYVGESLKEKESLLFLDEIQACPEAIVVLRYFYEKKPNLHVIAAGSLLDHALNELEYAMPVGRIEFGYMYPMNFYEFLNALDEGILVNFLKSHQINEKIMEPIHKKLMDYVHLYFVIGGMPEAVKVYCDTKKLLECKKTHESITKSLEFDFAKYGSRAQQKIMIGLLKYIPKSIGEKFKYSNFDDSIRAANTKEALDLLGMSRIIHFVNHTKTISIPLETGERNKLFKLIFLDIGLLNHLLKTPFQNNSELTTNNTGSISEQFIGQELKSFSPFFTENNLHYWVREKRNSAAEIDFITNVNNTTIPIEVKAGKTGTLKSLHVLMLEKKLKKAIRFNADIPSITEVNTALKINNSVNEVSYSLTSLPLYLVREIHRFI